MAGEFEKPQTTVVNKKVSSCLHLESRTIRVVWVTELVFFSFMDYSDVIYGHASTSTLKPLDAVYHSTLDVYSTHHCILYKKDGWSSLTETWEAFVFVYITSMLDWSSGTHHRRSNDWLSIQVPRVGTDLGRSAFCFYARTTWNSKP